MAHSDEYWMEQALNLAEMAIGQTSPNPLVGAVLVKNGEIVGSGYHQKAGGAHAEILALAQAGSQARAADLYVTLEPCAHYGRTPPCSAALIEASIKRAVVAMVDPNPLTSGKGITQMRQAGITVECGVLEERARRLNAVFITYITKKRPYVLWKVASTLDGKTATRTGASKWITGEKARALVHRRRQQFDGIMAGIGTVLADDPLLNARPPDTDPATIKQPCRIIIDSKLRIPLTARCLAPQTAGRAIVATTAAAPPSKIELLRQRGVEVWIDPQGDEQVDLAALLRDLAKLEITSIFLEGGATLAGSFFDRQLIDACLLFLAPKLFGGSQAHPSLGGLGVEAPADAPSLHQPRYWQEGADLVIEGPLIWPPRSETDVHRIS